MAFAGPAFIIGCARSGTTWLGRTVACSPDCAVTIEHTPTFQLVDRMVLDPRTIQGLLPVLAMLYRREMALARPRRLVDKSHQNIWLVEALRSKFADARFVGIERDVYAAVASMRRHPGVLRHFQTWKSYPLPNRHIGLSPDLAPLYDALPVVVKCALRWSAHHHRLQCLVGEDYVLALRYEDLVRDPTGIGRRLSAFLQARVPAPQPDLRTVARGGSGLSASDRRAVGRALTAHDMAWVVDV